MTNIVPNETKPSTETDSPLSNFDKQTRKPVSRHMIFIFGTIALLLLGFIGGQAFERARVKHLVDWKDNYERNFFGDKKPAPRGMRPDGGMMGGPFRSHAIVGTILSINNNNVSIQDNDGSIEQSITISDSTVIQKINGRGAVSDLETGQRIAIFGRPVSGGRVEATLIRVLDKITPTPTITSSPQPSNQPK